MSYQDIIERNPDLICVAEGHTAEFGYAVIVHRLAAAKWLIRYGKDTESRFLLLEHAVALAIEMEAAGGYVHLDRRGSTIFDRTYRAVRDGKHTLPESFAKTSAESKRSRARPRTDLSTPKLPPQVEIPPELPTKFSPLVVSADALARYDFSGILAEVSRHHVTASSGRCVCGTRTTNRHKHWVEVAAVAAMRGYLHQMDPPTSASLPRRSSLSPQPEEEAG